MLVTLRICGVLQVMCDLSMWEIVLPRKGRNGSTPFWRLVGCSDILDYISQNSPKNTSDRNLGTGSPKNPNKTSPVITPIHPAPLQFLLSLVLFFYFVLAEISSMLATCVPDISQCYQSGNILQKSQNYPPYKMRETATQ